MFKIRQVYNEKVQEFEIATKPEEEVDEKTNDESTSSASLSTTTSSTTNNFRQNLQSSSVMRGNSSTVSTSMRPSNFEDGYKSDLY